MGSIPGCREGGIGPYIYTWSSTTQFHLIIPLLLKENHMAYSDNDPNSPTIKLFHHGSKLLVSASQGDHPPTPIPKIPRIHMDWLIHASNHFWLTHQRCLAFVLLFSPKVRMWSFELPEQTCSAQGSTWSLTGLPPIPADKVIAGSFQTRGGRIPAKAAIPSFLGLHFIHYPDHQRTSLQALLQHPESVDQNLISIDPEHLMQDDYTMILQAHADSLTLI